MSTPLSTSPQAPIGAPVTITLNESYFGRRNWFDWLFALVVIAGGIFAFLLLVVISSTVAQLYGERTANRLV